MKRLSAEKLYILFADAFSHCGLFLLELGDEDILYYLFEEFDTDAITFLHKETLDRLWVSRYIDKEIYAMCQLLRDKYFRLGIDNEKIWSVEEIKASSDWLDLFRLADEIRMRLPENID